MDKVYIVVVNYNGFQDTIECLESLLKSSYLNFRIFVVDNSPGDLSMHRISNWLIDNNYNDISTGFNDLVYPLTHKPIDHCIVPEPEFRKGDRLFENKITVVRAINNGFAAANNLVLDYILKKEPDPAFIWLLNNDTVVEKDTLSNLINFYQNNADGKYILGAKLRYYDKPQIIQAVAGKYNKWIGKHTHIGNGEEDNGQYDYYNPGKMVYIVGASIFLPKKFIEEVGLMCEDYFLYFEELDWIQRSAEYGYKTALAPNAIVYHKEGASIINDAGGNDTSVAAYYSITNRVRFIKKWYPYCLPTVMAGVTWALIKRIIQGKFSLVKKISIAVFKIMFK